MAELAVVLARAANAETCVLTGLTVSVVASSDPLLVTLLVTNIGVSQDPVDDASALLQETLATPATLRTTISPPIPPEPSLAARAPPSPPPDIQREFPPTQVAGEAVVPWTVDVPEGFYIVSARIDGGAPATIIDSPRFWVSAGPDVSCLNRVASSPSLSDAPSDTPSPAPSPGDGDATSPSASQSGSGTAKLLLPPAAIVGIAIGAAALLVLCVLICTWDRNRHRNAAAREKEMRQVHRLSSSSSFFDRDLGSRAWHTTTNPTMLPQTK
ncbi:hypothetical protein AURDEDRAFT_151694 [Auricularia subglabra TFB-10046 SS5]|nr:hypothetical protein AURDEDRAFT_151694 [Auricularia subglabra TFB-10046 SS5]